MHALLFRFINHSHLQIGRMATDSSLSSMARRKAVTENECALLLKYLTLPAGSSDVETTVFMSDSMNEGCFYIRRFKIYSDKSYYLFRLATCGMHVVRKSSLVCIVLRTWSQRFVLPSVFTISSDNHSRLFLAFEIHGNIWLIPKGSFVNEEKLVQFCYLFACSVSFRSRI